MGVEFKGKMVYREQVKRQNGLRGAGLKAHNGT